MLKAEVKRRVRTERLRLSQHRAVVIIVDRAFMVPARDGNDKGQDRWTIDEGTIGRWLCCVVAGGAGRARCGGPAAGCHRTARPRRPSATAAGECTGCFTTRPTPSRTTFIGYPDTFIEPPLGYYINQQFAVQVSKADTASVHALQLGLPAGHGPVLADRRVAVQPDVRAAARLVRSDRRRVDSRSAGPGPGAPPGGPRRP